MAGAEAELLQLHNRDHAVNGAAGAHANILGHAHLVLHALKAPENLFKRGLLHIGAKGKLRCRIKGLARVLVLQAVHDAKLRADDELPCARLMGPAADAFGGKSIIGKGNNGVRAFGMHEHLGCGMSGLLPLNMFRRNAHMRGAVTLPEYHLAARLLYDKCAKILVGHENNLFGVFERLHDLHRV